MAGKSIDHFPSSGLELRPVTHQPEANALAQHSDIMKRHQPFTPGFLTSLLGIISLFLASSLPAATLTWDANGTTAPLGFDGYGSWMAPNNWSDGGANVSWSAATDIAVFGSGTDGTYAIDLSGLANPSAAAIQFKNSGYTVTNDVPVVIGLGTVANQLAIASGKTATIGTNVIIEVPGAASQFLFIGAPTAGAVAAGTLNIENGATVRCTAVGGSVVVDGVGTVVNVKTGGTLTGSGKSVMSVGAAAGANCTLNIQGGTWSSTSDDPAAALFIGQRGIGTVTLSSGVASAKPSNTTYGLYLAQRNGGGGTFNLDGGTLSVPVIKKGTGTGGAVFNFNGGTLQALANSSVFMQGLTSANVKAGGAIIDDGGFTITIAQALLAGTPSGGLTKLGDGTLTLSGANTYEGVTTVSNGTLRVSGSLAGDASVQAGATLAGNGTVSGDVIINSGGALTAGDSLGAGNLTLGSLRLGVASGDTQTVTVNPGSSRIDVTGSLVKDGLTTINIVGTPPPGATTQLITYVGDIITNGFVLAPAEIGTLQYNSGSIDIVTPDSPRWSGGESGLWNTTALNWQLIAAGTPTNYVEGNPVLFDDNLTANPDVILNTTVTPGAVTFANESTVYTLGGSGGIAGANSLTKSGAGTVVIGTANTYTGGTKLMGTGILGLGNSSALGTGLIELKSARTDDLPTVLLTGGITVTNPILMDTTTGRESFYSTNGNNTITGPISIVGSTSSHLLFRNNGDPGTVFVISNTISGPNFPAGISLRGMPGALGLIAGQVAINSQLEINGSATWTIASTGNTWTRTVIQGADGSLVLGANDALATTGRLTMSGATSGAFDLAGYNQLLGGLESGAISVIPGPTIGNSSITSDALLRINGAGYSFSGALVDALGAGTRKLSVELLSGTQTLKGVNTYTGPTTISGGTLVLNTTGSILNSAQISVASGATLDVSTVNGGFVLDTAQTLAGNGNVLGAVTVNGTLAPGDSIGTLTFNSDLSFQGTTVMEIARNGAVLGSDLVAGVSTLTYGGTLIVTNVGSSALQVGDVFQLFSAAAYNPAFANVVYPTGYTFTDNLAVDGSITVLTVPNAAPPTLSYTASGGNWVFNWAESGFKLQTQTNALDVGLGTNWVDVPGGDVSGVSVPGPNAGNPAVFFRLISTP